MAYLLQSSKKPAFGQHPAPDRGYMIRVATTKPCPYGTSCYRKRPSVSSYDEGGTLHLRHDAVHWHIAEKAKWTNGVQTL